MENLQLEAARFILGHGTKGAGQPEQNGSSPEESGNGNREAAGIELLDASQQTKLKVTRPTTALVDKKSGEHHTDHTVCVHPLTTLRRPFPLHSHLSSTSEDDAGCGCEGRAGATRLQRRFSLGIRGEGLFIAAICGDCNGVAQRDVLPRIILIVLYFRQPREAVEDGI